MMPDKTTERFANELYPTLDVDRAVRVLKPKTIQSPDGRNAKFLMMTAGGQLIETGVFDHRMVSDWDGDNHLIICISSQVGCAQRCPTCESGAPKKIPGQYKPVRLIRNLTAEEMVDQAVNAVELSGAADDNSLLLLSMMGMGEPMDNYDALRSAIDQFAARWPDRCRVTVSTICREKDIPNIVALADDMKNTTIGIPLKMHFSLHAPNDDLRKRLIPMGGPLKTVLDTAFQFAQISGTHPKLNYVLINGRNDSVKHASQLAELLREHPVSKVATLKLSELNPYGPYQPSPPETVARFAEVLTENGISVTRFSSSLDGGLVHAGCGQLQKHVLKEILYQNPQG